jgi:prepilin-type N-terminal cleavage/methylation domain-containing protein
MRKKGFTLIELLIVMAIIGILAAALLVSLGGARQSGRDARRIADLKQVQGALELFFNKCGAYPANVACDISKDPGKWEDLETVMKASNIGLNRIPYDPNTPTSDYRYSVNGSNQGYIVGATLEGDNAVLKNSISSCVGFSATCACDNSATNRQYCIGL